MTINSYVKISKNEESTETQFISLRKPVYNVSLRNKVDYTVNLKKPVFYKSLAMYRKNNLLLNEISHISGDLNPQQVIDKRKAANAVDFSIEIFLTECVYRIILLALTENSELTEAEVLDKINGFTIVHKASRCLYKKCLNKYESIIKEFITAEKSNKEHKVAFKYLETCKLRMRKSTVGYAAKCYSQKTSMDIEDVDTAEVSSELQIIHNFNNKLEYIKWQHINLKALRSMTEEQKAAVRKERKEIKDSFSFSCVSSYISANLEMFTENGKIYGRDRIFMIMKDTDPSVLFEGTTIPVCSVSRPAVGRFVKSYKKANGTLVVKNSVKPIKVSAAAVESPKVNNVSANETVSSVMHAALKDYLINNPDTTCVTWSSIQKAIIPFFKGKNKLIDQIGSEKFILQGANDLGALIFDLCEKDSTFADLKDVLFTEDGTDRFLVYTAEEDEQLHMNNQDSEEIDEDDQE